MSSPHAEGLKGVTEFIQPVVRFPFLMRVVLPGAFVAGLLYPVAHLGLETALSTSDFALREAMIVLSVIVLSGVLVTALNGEFYKVYEGRILWPRFLFDWFRVRHISRIKKLIEAGEKAKLENRITEFNEIWFRLRIYPLDKNGDPTATHPTQLGNILSAYEDYPKSRYGMDSVFYWPRLWLELDKEKKEEIDGSWSIADGLLSISAICFLGGIAWVTIAMCPQLSITGNPPFTTPLRFAFSGVSLMILGYLVYRVSLPFHRKNGELFKAIYDLYRDRITAMTQLGPFEKQSWEGTWSYLQYHYVYCVKCRKYFPAHEEKCRSCGHPSADSLLKLRRDVSKEVQAKESGSQHAL